MKSDQFHTEKVPSPVPIEWELLERAKAVVALVHTPRETRLITVPYTPEESVDKGVGLSV